MKPHQIYVALALTLLFALTAAVADTRLSSGQITNSLQGVTDTQLSLTAAELRQTAVDNIRNYPGPTPIGHLLVIPQLDKLAQFTVEINFDFNSAAIRPESYRDVGAIADALHNPILLGYGILVIGHTDTVGGREYNLNLSQRRADAVVQYLASKYGIAAHRFYLIGIGKDKEVAPNTTKEGRKQNRRVEIQLLTNVGESMAAPSSGGL